MTRVQADEFRPIHFALQEIMTIKRLSEQMIAWHFQQEAFRERRYLHVCDL